MIGTILAIDPGTTQSAWILYGEGHILGFGKLLNKAMLLVVEECQATRMAIEMPACYGMTVGKSVFETCRWVGIFQHAFGLSKTHIVYRKAQNKEEGIEGVCMHLCHNNRAKDGNVRQAILDRYPETGGGKTPQIGTKAQPGPLYGVSGDVWSALAVAITFDESYSMCREPAERLELMSIARAIRKEKANDRI